ncbi:MAG: sulfatase-like hydrolase/transferase [Rikenellaceae bacterium]
MKKRDITLLSTLAVSSFMSAAQAATAPDQKPMTSEKKQRPNVIIIFGDDHRYDAIHALGGTVVKTPNLDAIINNGVSFDNAYLQGANTGATSAASRAQLLTGRGVFGIPKGNGSPWTKDITTFPEAFRDAGYFTFFTGKSHNGEDASSRGFTGGAKLYGLSKGFYKPHFRMPYQDYREDQSYNKKHLYFVGGENHDEKIKPSETSEYVGPHSTDIFGKAAVDFIDSYDCEKPLLMYIAFHAPHDTRNYTEKYKDMYDPADIPLPVNFREEHPFDNGDLYVRDERLAPYPRTKENTKSQIADYYRTITHVDDKVGEIVEALKRKGLDKNTIFVISTDSGLGMGSHGLFGKQNLYDDAGIRVPMVFSGAGIPKGKRKTDICYSADIFPTICDLAGVEIPKSVTGLSQAKSVMGGSQYRRKVGYFAYMEHVRAVRNERYKLIEYCVDGKRHTQLFDLENDRYECNDLSNNPDNEALIKELRAELVKQSEQEYGAEWGVDFWRTYMRDYDRKVLDVKE